ncbi:erythromycin esterase [Saccharopolyspora antimicrobica]|uniref:Erythromycin esterase n=1 Tax=Saccharopolyspora antimicrobica TaxID=455193 RepID=A0A1I4SPY9_9PSEU|nr:erythromycin esterase family protein [Saccharopolyspora antimicrobica]RKT86050.1 erythromycin esterase [Saccharopolyspora antimicrobica]SFM66546.1 erythromycin esterase [Saccharopolyspora antimicrobica]
MTNDRTPADWFRARSHALTSLDADAPLDDLEPLREIVGDARVVALGEGAHFVREFTDTRQRMLRFLAERCGFTVLTFEFGFSEGIALDRWLRGSGGEAELAGLAGTTNAGVNPALVRWLREHNSTSGHPLRFAGLDTPVAGGQLRPALEPVADYLREVDPDAASRIDTALSISDRITGTSVAVAAPNWGGLATAEQDALTASLARLLVRVRSMEPLYVSRSDQERYDVALRHLEAAVRADYMFGAMRSFFEGDGLLADPSARDHYMAESMRWWLDRLPAGTRIALAAHNNHVQKSPVFFGDELALLPLGHYLARMLGDGYRALAQTHTAERIPEIYPNAAAEVGFDVVDVQMPDPAPGSVEAALVDAGRGGQVTLTDLRGGPEGLVGIRAQSENMPTPVVEAFDGVVSVPTATAYYTTSLSG